jgi:ketosteroid isomerase-like protein
MPRGGAPVFLRLIDDDGHAADIGRFRQTDHPARFQLDRCSSLAEHVPAATQNIEPKAAFMTNHAETLALAERFVAAIARGDIETIKACYAPDARIWHNFDEVEQTLEQNLATLGWLSKRLLDRHYEIIARNTFDGGFVQQHVLTGTLRNGEKFRMPACIICRVKDGRIVRLDEYLDMAAAAALRAA